MTSSETKKINVAILGTGIFATNAHYPSLSNSPYFTAHSCYNRTKAKAETFSKLSNPSLKVYESFDDAFNDPQVDLIDALLPSQFNVTAVRQAVKSGKNIVMEKPIAANLDQAREIVELSKSHPELVIAVSEHWCYFKSIHIIKNAITKIGNVVGFNYHSTGSFNFKNVYLSTTWRQHPEHIGGFLSDGGVHQLALLCGVLGNVKTVNARTKQVREQSGDVDVVWSLLEMKTGVIGSFNYGSAFGKTDKKCYFEILGDNGSIYYDFSPGQKEEVVKVKVGGLTADSESSEESIKVENEYRSTDREFEVLGKALNGDKSELICYPEVAFHHLAIVDAMVRSSKSNCIPVTVEKP